MGEAGSAYTIFRRAVEVGDPLRALAAAHELPPLTLADALALTLLLRVDGVRFPRAIDRWLGRLRAEVTTVNRAEAELAHAAFGVVLERPELGGHALAELFELHGRDDLARAVDGWLERTAAT